MASAPPTLSIALVSDTGGSSTDRITSYPVVRGVGQPNTLIMIKEGGVTLGIAIASSTGAWSFIPPGLADGTHTLTATQTDSDGNTATVTLSFTLDRAAPVVSIALVSDTGSSPSDKITSNPAVKGVGQANTLVTIKEGGVTLGTTVADATGAWSFTPAGLAEGPHVFSASQTDLAGNTATATLSLTLDRAAPVVSIALVSDTGSSSSDKITSNPAVKGVGQANTLMTIKEGGVTLGTTTTDGAGAWSFTPAGLADGAHTFSVSQTDLAGNTGTATLNFTLDSSQGNPPPAVSIALVSDTGSSASDKITSNPAVKGLGQANTLVTIKEGGATLGTTVADANGAWSFTPAGLTDGAHTLTASQTDSDGNTGSATLSLTLDRAAPVMSIALVSDTGSSPSDKITANPAVKGVGQANTLVTIKEGGATLGTTTADGTGAWSFTPVGLAEGAHVFGASQTDLAGNTGTATLNFTLDSSQGNPPPPSGLSMALFSDTGSSATDHITSRAAIKGAGYAGTVLTIKEGGTTLGALTVDSTGNWGFTPAGLADGAHTLTATQIIAGNTVTATLSFTLDRTAPVLSMALLSDDGGSSSDGITSNPAIKGVGGANSLVTIKEGAAVLGTVMTDGAGTWSFIQPGISVGARTLTATQTDLAGNTGTTTLSFTLAVPQPTQGGDIVGLLLQNTGAVVEENGYVTFGQVFKPGAVRPGDSLVARIAGVDYAVQMDVKATNSDGSVRHAVLTLNAPEIAPSGNLAVMLAKGSAVMPSPAAPSAAALLAGGYNLDVAFTFRNAGGTTTTANASAAAALQAAITAGTVQRWLTGPEVNEYSVVTTVNGGKLKVEFDIRAYADGTTSTDVIFDNSWMFAPGKSDLTYDVAIRQDGQQVYGASNVFQYLYSLWDHRVDSAGTINPNVQYDNSYLIAAAALPAYDQSYRVSDTAIQKDYNRLDPSISAGYGSTGPMGTAEVTTYMPSTGGRPDIGPQPNWVAQWVLSQSSTAEAVMMANADASGSIPWHLIDENTGKPINSEDYPRFYEDPRNNVPGNAFWSPQPVNGWPTYGANGDPWTPDRAHVPDLNYVPYLIIGSHYQLRLLQDAANFVDLNMSPYAKYNNNPPGSPGGDIYLGLANYGNQARGIAWSLRQIAEAAYLTPDGDPQKAHFTKLLNDTMDGLVQYYVTGGYNNKFGDIQGFLMGYGEQYSQIAGPWMQDYIVTTFGEIAGMSIPGASDNAIKMLKYMDSFISGLYTRGSDGFNPYNGAAYYLKIIDPVTQTPVTTWAQLAQVNSADYPLDATSLNSNYPTSTEAYVVLARTALANIITYTQSPQAIEAYGFVTGQIAVAWGRNPAGMVAAFQGFPSWNVMPRLPDREYLQASQMQIDVSNSPSVTLSANNRDSLLSVVGTGTATLTGGAGSDLLFGGSGPTTLKAGTGNDYLFAGAGSTTFIDDNGNDYMKGGSAADKFTFADIHPGHDTIVNFKIETDVLKIAPNLDGIHVAGAAQLIAAATVVGGSTVLHFGPNHDVTIRGIDTPLTLIGSILVS